MSVINYHAGSTTVSCPVCHAVVEFDPQGSRLPRHKRADMKIYNCPGANEEYSFVEIDPNRPAAVKGFSARSARGGAASVSQTRETQSSRKPRVKKKKLSSSERYQRRVEHLATRQERYAERDFAIWAEDSFGSDDVGTGSRHSVRSVSGGRVQSNRQRY